MTHYRQCFGISSSTSSSTTRTRLHRAGLDHHLQCRWIKHLQWLSCLTNLASRGFTGTFGNDISITFDNNNSRGFSMSSESINISLSSTSLASYPWQHLWLLSPLLEEWAKSHTWAIMKRGLRRIGVPTTPRVEDLSGADQRRFGSMVVTFGCDYFDYVGYIHSWRASTPSNGDLGCEVVHLLQLMI